MRILLMANNVQELGGAQRVVHVLAQGLADRGHDVVIVGITPHPVPYCYQVNPSYREVTLLDGPYPKPSAARIQLEAVAMSRLQSLLDEGPPGVIITAQLWAMEHLERCRRNGWAVIGQYHSSYEAAAAGRDLARAKAVYRDVDAFALLCDEDAAAFRAHGFWNTVTMPNPLATWPEEVSPSEEQSVTYLGRFSPEKGPRFLLEAWGMLAATHPGWRLEMIGSGPLEEELREGLGAGLASMTFHPPTAEPMRVLMNTAILALPSLTEGFPLALAEAMACGVACVASDCSSGVLALVDDGRTGLIARRGDAAHLAEQLARLMESADLRTRLGLAARLSVERLQLPAVIDRWEALFTDVLR
jgi:glycosyltransferase involved in cell wall biosynthesis